MRAIILAAGEGTRLQPHTLDRPKCLVPLCGKPLLEYQLESLHEAGITDIRAVVGYRGDQVRQYIPTIYENPEWNRTNMVASLMCAADALDGSDDILVAYSDIIYEPAIIQALQKCDAPLATTVDTQWQNLWNARMDDPLADAETLKIDPEGNIREIGKKPQSLDDIQAQYMGLIKISKALAPQLVNLYNQLDPSTLYEGRDLGNMYMTTFLQWLIDENYPLRAVDIASGWLEVDSTEDLQRYEALCITGEMKTLCSLPMKQETSC